MARMIFPTRPVDLVDAVKAEMASSTEEMNVNYFAWKIIDQYMQGGRKFHEIDRRQGQLEVAYDRLDGQLALRYEEVVRLFLIECGRYMKLNTEPTARRRGDSLGALREAATAQAMLSGLGSRLDHEGIKRSAIIPLLKYGTVGLMHSESTGQFPDRLNIVHPMELRGFPARCDGTQNVQAVARYQIVPVEWIAPLVKTRYKKDIKRTDKIMARSVGWGTPSSSSGNEAVDNAGIGALPERPTISHDKGAPRREDGAHVREVVPLTEIFVLSDCGTMVARTIVLIGEYVVYDEDFEAGGREVVCPLRIARHTDIGRFFARGFVSPLVTLNDQVEKMLASAFQNMAELDTFGTLFVPGSSGIDLKRWRKGKRPRAEYYEPDPLNAALQPMNLAPANPGDAPVKMASLGVDLLNKQANQGPAFSGNTSGRVDSAAGLGVLFNTNNMGLFAPVSSLADAYSGVYARMLQAGKDRMEPGDAVWISTTDDSVAGIMVSADGRMSLAANPVPEPWKVTIDIKDRTPRDPEIRKQELMALYQQGLVDYLRFWVTAFEENLDFPGAPKDLWETWRKAVWQIIQLFQDGENPGEMFAGKHTQDPEVQLVAVQTFMNKIEFSLASEAVQNRFIEWKELLEAAAGRNFPVGLGEPQMAAQMAAQAGPGGQGGGMPGGMPPDMAAVMAGPTGP